MYDKKWGVAPESRPPSALAEVTGAEGEKALTSQ